LKILYVSEIVGKAGIFVVKKLLPEIKRKENIEFVIACADGATGGYGLGRNHAAYLHKLGINVLTTGDCCFYKKDLVQELNKISYVLRPANLSPFAPGTGVRIYHAGDKNIAVILLIGQMGFGRFHGENPYIVLPELLEKVKEETATIIVDIHASTTAEKIALSALADGRCSAVIGSHGRVQTADARILKEGTATICDAGRTGSLDSVGGTNALTRITEYRTGIPDWTKDAWDRLELQGVILDIDLQGKAFSIQSIKIPCMEQPDERDRTNTEDRNGNGNC
jgi:metallophosphoesterase (TIGR00282 family)